MTDDKPVREQDKFMLRLPDGMRERIADAAKSNKRSMNAEIVAALEDAYPDPARFREELAFIDEIDEIQARLDKIRAARIAEASSGFSDDFIIENAEKLRPKRTSRKKKTGE
ncbi:hypothetical protein ATY75_03260 [Rhizobium sp. N122]|uniref:Arc family DNA-binding protein n=1 Tax=Rhizobium sp. N122 TaxID=1764272 RepID=UPI000B741E53|nr:Arc family DNA-binding protein [Rhizobium sp. N122]OWV87342.1 hypothetical protein ATY75_03260 [Rhizobium sp. N122]